MKKKTALILSFIILAGSALCIYGTADAYRGRYSGLHGVPQGTIVLWSGATVPSGWSICNGENGTPDLRGKFVIGVNASPFTLNSAGGSQNTSSEASGLDSGNVLIDSTPGGDFNSLVDNHYHTFTPPYHALYYIMKL